MTKLDLSTWSSIAGAPKDGSWIAVRSGDCEPCAAYWDARLNGWQTLANMEEAGLGYDEWPVDLWKPLPVNTIDAT